MTNEAAEQLFQAAQLREAFDKVSNADWREPIIATIDAKSYILYEAAVMFYTGTQLEVAAQITFPGTSVVDKLVVKADGYRLGPCGP